MNETKYTPGPWSIDYDTHRSPNIWIHAKGNSGIAKVEICDYSDGLGHRITEEDHANSRLIAAAPDLLEACKAIVYEEDRDCGQDILVSRVRLQKCIDAIAKAEAQS